MNLFKSYCFLFIVMTPFVSAADFQDKYLSCTLVESGDKTISEREAKGKNEFNIDVVIKQSEAIFKNETFLYSTTTDDGYDKYRSNPLDDNILFKASNYNLIFTGMRVSTSDYKSYKFKYLYKCTSRDKSLLDTGSEMKLKLKSLF